LRFLTEAEHRSGVRHIKLGSEALNLCPAFFSGGDDIAHE
jgi:hypothetical protein